MKRLIYIAILKLKLTFKDKTAFVWMLLAPMLFVTVIFLGYGNSGSGGVVKYPLSVVDIDNGSYSRELVDMLKNDETFNISEEDYDTAKKHVQDGYASMGVVIPEGFSQAISEGKSKPVEIMKLQDNETTMALSPVIYNYIYQLKIGSQTGNIAVSSLSDTGKIKADDKENVKNIVVSSVLKNLQDPKITYKTMEVTIKKKAGLDGLSYSVIGILVMFMMFFITNSAGSILEERELKTWDRVMSTPVKEYSVLGGHMLGSLISGWLQVGVLTLMSRLVFNINWGSSPMGLVLLFTCFLLAIIGLGSALSSFVKTKGQLSALNPIIIVPTCMISGCLWPREIMPDFVLKASNFVPQTWVLKGMTDLVARNSDISAVYLPSIMLLIFACIFYFLGLVFLEFQKK